MKVAKMSVKIKIKNKKEEGGRKEKHHAQNPLCRGAKSVGTTRMIDSRHEIAR
jgi:hypothetical protein